MIHKNKDETLAKSGQLKVFTLGRFEVHDNERVISIKDWSRDKAIQLFQYFICNRHRRAAHKEQIIDTLWPDASPETGQRDFKVSLHGINKTLEPDRPNRQDPKYIIRQGQSYQLNLTTIWLDVDTFESYIHQGNVSINPDKSIEHLAEAVSIYQGPFLPERVYNEWTSSERERIQIITIGAIISLAKKMLDVNPTESIRLSQKALLIENTWEDAYRIQMEAYIKNGNRPQALRTYAECERVLDAEFGIPPLPETKKLLLAIESL